MPRAAAEKDPPEESRTMLASLGKPGHSDRRWSGTSAHPLYPNSFPSAGSDREYPIEQNPPPM
jgi:hypothetical protein